MTILLILIAGLSNGIMDSVTHHHAHKWISGKLWWDNDPENGSHLNKYINRDISLGRRKLFKYFNYPVIITDAWHCFKSIMIWSLLLSLLTYEPIFMHGELLGYDMPEWSDRLFDIITLRLVFALGFHIPYQLTK